MSTSTGPTREDALRLDAADPLAAHATRFERAEGVVAYFDGNSLGRPVAGTAEAMADSREVLRENGNMSSATVLFVLERMLATARPGEKGCAMAFGPGLTAETMLFTVAPARAGVAAQAPERTLDKVDA